MGSNRPQAAHEANNQASGLVSACLELRFSLSNSNSSYLKTRWLT